jgi:hypothetical protein
MALIIMHVTSVAWRTAYHNAEQDHLLSTVRTNVLVDDTSRIVSTAGNHLSELALACVQISIAWLLQVFCVGKSYQASTMYGTANQADDTIGDRSDRGM